MTYNVFGGTLNLAQFNSIQHFQDTTTFSFTVYVYACDNKTKKSSSSSVRPWGFEPTLVSRDTMRFAKSPLLYRIYFIIN